MTKEEKTYFTEITEYEKKIINLIRGYVVPTTDIEDYFAFLVDVLSQKLLDKTVRLQAFVEVMQDKNRSKWSNIETLARINQFEDFITGQKEIMDRYLNNIYHDMLKTTEGDILPIDVYNSMEKLQEEEKYQLIRDSLDPYDKMKMS